MKRSIAAILALLLALSLAACGGSGEKAPEPTKAPETAQASETVKTPAATEALAPKEKLSKEAIAAALDKAETAADLQALIDAMEGDYGEDEEIELEGDTLTLAQLREMQALFAMIEGLGDEPAVTGTPATGDALAAVGEWTGVYCKFVGSEDGETDEPFSLTLNADGTGTHFRDDLELTVTWAMTDGEFTMTEHFMGMTIDYTGTLSDGVLHLYNDTPTDPFTYEYVYGQGDVSGIEIPRGEHPLAEGLAAYRGDWNGALGFRECTGKYAYLDNENVGAIARFAVQPDGSIDAFIGIDVEDTPFVGLSAYYSDFWECLMLSGSWINVSFESVSAEVKNGTLSFTIPIAKEAGSLNMVFNLRRLDDEGWTDENPGLSRQNIEVCKGKSFGELASLLGYDFMDYPSPDEG